MSTLRQVQNNGDTAEYPLVLENLSTSDCFNAKIVFSIPSGVRLTGPSDQGSSFINVPQGFYSSSDTTWYYGDLLAGKKIEHSFTFTVDDISLADADDNDRFLVTATLTTSCTESNSANNVDSLIIEVQDPCTQISLSIGTEGTTTSSADLSIG